MYFNEINTVD